MRRVLRVVAGSEPHWVGDGFLVRTMFSYDREAAAVDPFLLLDYGAPREFPPTSERRGVGAHPHRGFETVTIALQGEVEHRDSAGHRGRIGPGDVQWMTAASGVLHEEFHGSELARRGGTLEMAQIWVNLPAASKRSAPRYQDIAAARIPSVSLPDGAGDVRVIAGDLLGTRGPARTVTPIELWLAGLARGSRADLPVPEGHTALVLVTRGSALVSEEAEVPEGRLAILDRRGGGVSVRSDGGATLLVLGGEPIGEPVVGYGPFVMNTHEEIAAAIRDVQSGRLGRLE